MTPKSRKWNLPLTYGPKIEAVKTGLCRQTIRVIGKAGPKRPGDLISLHGYVNGRGTPWTWRTPYFAIIEAIPLEIYDAGVWMDPEWCKKSSGKFWWSDLAWLAALDGIVPATGEELKRVLTGKNNLCNCKGIEAQIIRWDPRLTTCEVAHVL